MANEKLKKVIKTIRNINKEVIIMVDNCYCEFVGLKEPLEIGVDVIVGWKQAYNPPKEKPKGGFSFMKKK
jgi:cystathionine beta-lyase family protein involved in aluminum resistance